MKRLSSSYLHVVPHIAEPRGGLARLAFIHIGVFGWKEHQEASVAQTGTAFNPLGNGRPGGSEGWDPSRPREVGMDYDAAYRDMFFVGDVRKRRPSRDVSFGSDAGRAPRDVS